jgi:hypothetical protein
MAAPATKITAASAATIATRHRVCAGHQRPSRRCVHNRTVVTSTEPQDGSAALGLPIGPPVPVRTGGSAGCVDGSGSDAASQLPGEMADRDSPAEPPWPDTGRPQSVPRLSWQPKRPDPMHPWPPQTRQATFA